MGKLPAYLFYPNDWRSDPNLCRVSKTARDTWMDMNCLMFFSEERGVLISGGKPWTDEEIAGAIRGDYMTNLRDIAELLDKGVAFRDQRGAIFCKRMVRDEAERQKTKKRVTTHREKRSCNGDVTPMKRPCTETENVTEILPTRFKLEDFDGHDEFESLCSVYPKAERSLVAKTRYFEALEWCVDTKRISRKEASSYIHQRAELYVSICKFQKGLTRWLEDKTFEQPESAWSDKAKEVSNGKSYIEQRLNAAFGRTDPA